ncbi:MAG: ATP-binding cassette domain-containing protein [Candidatus Puniceispirillaceae bacterium]
MSEQHRRDHILSTHQLSLKIGSQDLLKEISLVLPKGRITLVIGHNGAGKTLLLHTLHGLITPTSGTISLPAQDQQKMVFQKPILLRRSVEAHLAFLAPSLNATERKDWLAHAGLAEKADQPARQLSGGEAQKLALIGALAAKPKLLFLDEPTASLDLEATRFVEDALIDARAQGLSIIMTSHNRTQIKRLADHIIFLEKGHCLESSPAEPFFSQPLAPAAQAWLDFA